MNCVADLLTLKALAEAKHLVYEASLDAEAKENFKYICEKTESICDTDIDADFVNLASNREPLSKSYKIEFSKDRLGNRLFRFVKPDGKVYADGTISESVQRSDEDIDYLYSWEFLEKYLLAHCFTLSIEDCFYRQYGFGERECKQLTISAEE